MYKTIEIYILVASKTDEKCNSILQAALFSDALHMSSKPPVIFGNLNVHGNAHICTSLT